MLLSVTLNAALVLVFPAWLVALSAILLVKARSIPKDVMLPPAVGGASILGRISTRSRGWDGDHEGPARSAMRADGDRSATQPSIAGQADHPTADDMNEEQETVADSVKRDVLPIPDPQHVGVTTYDAKGPRHQVPADHAASATERRAERADHPHRRCRLSAPRSAFGGPCNTPNFERLAADGLKYTRFHTTALCSPTRAALLLSGRNHHSVGMGGITEIATSAPGLQLRAAEEQGAIGGDPQAQRLLDGAVRQVPRGAGLGDEPDGPVRRLAHGQRLRALLRVHRRRDEPVRAGHLPRHGAGRAGGRPPARTTTSPRT